MLVDNENKNQILNQEEINNNETSAETVKPNLDFDMNTLVDYYQYTKKHRVTVLVCFCLFFLIIPILVGAIIELIWCVKTLVLDVPELKNDALIWGLLCLLLLPIIPLWVMKSKAENVLKKYNIAIQ